MSIENRSLKLPHSSGVLCGQKRSIFGEGIAECIVNCKLYYKFLVFTKKRLTDYISLAMIIGN